MLLRAVIRLGLAFAIVSAGKPRLIAGNEQVPTQSPARSAGAVDFGRDVFPILQRSCFECHGADSQEGGFRLDRRQDLLQSGTIEAGRAADSELLRRVALPRGHEEIMPAVGRPLASQQVDVIRRWIDQGAEWPDDFRAGKHWSYVAPRRPPLPSVSQPGWATSPIDRFVLKRLDEAGLSPSPRAEPASLVRRLYLDLIGLPPTPTEVDQFLQDRSSQRVERLVDNLLRRPQFGERWARPWLDLARYADSHGFQKDNLRDHWAYRDWVIRALNHDMPFDQFTIEQIAGDLLPDATESQRVATGFHRCTPSNVEAGSLPEETRIEQVIDRVNTTGAVWLGTTLECCQCHDHKYDPFSQEDYYRLLAYYNSTEREADRADPKRPSSIQFNGPSMPLSNPEREARRSELQVRLRDANQRLQGRRAELTSDLDAWATEMRRQIEQAPVTAVLDVVSFESEGDTDTFEKLDDGSILLVGGDPPETDVYHLRLRSDGLEDIRAIRIDALRDDALPGGGPGRGDPARRNFVLNEFSADVQRAVPPAGGESPQGEMHPLKFTSAQASFSQANWDVAGALQQGKKTGWAIAPQFDRSHWATFLLAEPLRLAGGDHLVVTLKQAWGNARTIGRVRVSAISGGVERESVPEKVVQVVGKPLAEWSQKDRQQVVDYRVREDAKSQQLTKEIAELKRQVEEVAADTTLVMIELKTPRPSTVFERGDYRKPGETVTPATPPILHAAPEGPENRLTLARWLVAPDNPLVARVTVNRLWAELFGDGIVTTLEDFGVKGDPPSHPQLLDWLAVEFVENGWSIKRILRTIVLSATYQQSSHVTPELLERDDRNRLLARGPRLRMDAEMIRDNALAIAGLLDLTQFGPSIRPFQPAGIWVKTGGTAYQYKVSPGSQRYRRGVYVVLKRGSPYPSFVNFDATARLACTVKRSRTNTPLQALTLLNDPVYVDAAHALADRVLAERRQSSFPDQLDYAFRLCTARMPTPAERKVLDQLFREQLELSGRPEAASDSSERVREAWRSVASVLLNLHETITKN